MLSRGDIITVALPGDYRNPRPAVVIQSDRLIATHPTILLCPLTTDLLAAPLARITVAPTSANGLRKTSQIMVDKIQALKREKARGAIGHLNDETIARLNDAIAYITGLAY